MALVKLTGKDGQGWHIIAGPSSHSAIRLDGLYHAPPRLRARHLPEWLDALLVHVARFIANRTSR